MLGWDWLRSPGGSYLRSTWMMLFLICTLWPRGKARLWWSIGKVRTFWLGRHVLHLGRAADGLLGKLVPTWNLMLGARLG